MVDEWVRRFCRFLQMPHSGIIDLPMRLTILPFFWVLITTVCSYGEASAQGISNKAVIDSISYQQFMNGDVSGLRQTLKEAQAAQVDFFYLRLRAALLYTRLGHFERSYPHAHRLMQINPYDTLAQRLWLLALRYTGRRTEELRWLSTCDSATFRRLTGTDRGRMDSNFQWESVSIGLGRLMEENYTSRRENVLERDALYTERTLQGPMNMLSVVFEGRLGKPSARNKAYCWRTIQSLGVFQSQPQGAWEVLSQNPTLTNQRFVRSYSIGALQVHGLLEYTPTHTRNRSIGLIWGTFTENSKHLSSVLLPNSFELAPVDCLFSNQSLLASVYGRYRFQGAELMASVGYANLAKQPQLQLDAGLTWFPGGRSSIFYTGSWSGLFSTLSDGIPARHILAHKLGCRVNKRWWAEGEYMSGLRFLGPSGAGGPSASDPSGARGLSNYTRPLTFQTFNTVEPILNLAGVGFVRYHQRGALRLGYQRQIRETTFYSIRQVPGSTTETILERNPQKHTLHLFNLVLTLKLHSTT